MHITHHTPEFQIHLENDEVVLHGSTEESAGVMLRGSVVLNCHHETTKVKSIILKFSGIKNINWAQASIGKHYKEEHIILEKEWVFLKPEKNVNNLSQGQYKWDFEIPLPGDLPESVHHEQCQINYRLKAFCDRPGFNINYIDKKDITVTRLLLPSAMEQSVLISNTWTDKVTYDISIPTKIYTCNKKIPISFDLVPLASGLKIKTVAISLKEYVSITMNDGQTMNKSETVKFLRNDCKVEETMGHFKNVELLQVPDSTLFHHHNQAQGLKKQVCFDMFGETIKIKHKLKFTVSLQNSDGHISELKAAVPVVIVPALPEDDENILPAYQEVWQSIPYVYNTTTVSSSCSDMTTTSSAGSSILEPEEEELFGAQHGWVGVDMNRVPSYTTALLATHVPCTLNPSLPPTYESIAIV